MNSQLKVMKDKGNEEAISLCLNVNKYDLIKE